MVVVIIFLLEIQMNLYLHAKVEEAIKFEGLLKKEKPNSNRYQDRYCKIIENGCVFAYAKKEEDFKKDNICGQFPIKDILDVQSDQLERFNIVTEDRLFKFRAETFELKEKWIKILKLLCTLAAEKDKKWESEIKAYDPTFIMETTKGYDNAPLSQSSSLSSSLKESTKRVILEGPIGIFKKRVDKVNDALVSEKHKTDQDYLQAKNFSHQLDLIDPKILSPRLKMGFMVRETKDFTKIRHVDNIVNNTGIRDVLARRWCLLLSSKPLILDNVHADDEETLQRGSIPVQLDFDTLYMYDEACDSSGALDEIPLKDVKQVRLEKKKHSEKFYRFVLELGERKINLLCTSFMELDVWLRAIAVSRATMREHQQSALPTLKNIYNMLRIKDGQNGQQELQKKAKASYETLTEKTNSTPNPTTILSIIEVQQKVAKEFIDIINACLVHRERRIDVVRVYEEVYHENILNALKVYFKKYTKSLTVEDILEVMKFLDWYQKSLIMFGPAFEDVRMLDGIRILGETSSRRILKINMKAVDNVLKHDIERDEPEINGKGELLNKSPQDIFKTLNETMDIIKLCNIDSLSLSLLKTCQYTLHYFRNGLKALISSSQLSNERLIAICNSNLTIIKETQDFVGHTQICSSPSSDVPEGLFNSKLLCREFAEIAKRSRLKLVQNVLLHSVEASSVKSFLSINIEIITKSALLSLEEYSSRMHKTHLIKLSLNMLKQIMNYYVKSLFESIERKLLKKEHLSNIVSHLSTTQGVLREIFSDLREKEVEETLFPIKQLDDLLTRRYELLTVPVHALKVSFGKSLKWSVMESIIKLREATIPKDERESLLDSCKDIFLTTEQTRHGRRELLCQDTESRRTDDEGDGDGDSSDTNFSFSDDTSEANGSRQSPTCSSAPSLTLSGYLGVENGFLKNIFGKTKYFTLVREHLYCYKDSSSESSIKAFNLKEAVDCQPLDQRGSYKFVLRIKEKNDIIKEHKFVSETKYQRNEWVKTISDAMNLPLVPIAIKLDKEKIIFKDNTTCIFTEIETMPSLEYRITKQRKVIDLEIQKKGSWNDFTELNSTKMDSSIAQDSDTSTIADSECKRKRKVGFCASICSKIWFVKKRADPSDYIAI